VWLAQGPDRPGSTVPSAGRRDAGRLNAQGQALAAFARPSGRGSHRRDSRSGRWKIEDRICIHWPPALAQHSRPVQQFSSTAGQILEGFQRCPYGACLGFPARRGLQAGGIDLLRRLDRGEGQSDSAPAARLSIECTARLKRRQPPWPDDKAGRRMLQGRVSSGIQRLPKQRPRPASRNKSKTAATVKRPLSHAGRGPRGDARFPSSSDTSSSDTGTQEFGASHPLQAVSKKGWEVAGESLPTDNGESALGSGCARVAARWSGQGAQTRVW